jgi:hypothetical protein
LVQYYRFPLLKRQGAFTFIPKQGDNTNYLLAIYRVLLLVLGTMVNYHQSGARLLRVVKGAFLSPERLSLDRIAISSNYCAVVFRR